MSGSGSYLTPDALLVLAVLYRLEFDPSPDQLGTLLAGVEGTVSRPEPVSPVPEYLIDAMLVGGHTNVRAGLALLQRLALIEPANEHIVFGEWERPDGSTLRAIPAWQNPDRRPDCQHKGAVDVHLDERPLMSCEYKNPNVVPRKSWRLTPNGVIEAIRELREPPGPRKSRIGFVAD